MEIPLRRRGRNPGRYTFGIIHWSHYTFEYTLKCFTATDLVSTLVRPCSLGGGRPFKPCPLSRGRHPSRFVSKLTRSLDRSDKPRQALISSDLPPSLRARSFSRLQSVGPSQHGPSLLTRRPASAKRFTSIRCLSHQKKIFWLVLNSLACGGTPQPCIEHSLTRSIARSSVL